LGSLIASFVLLGIASIIISTGKRKLRVDVNASVTVAAFSPAPDVCLGRVA